MHSISRPHISSTILKLGLRCVAQGKKFSDIEHSPYHQRFEGYPKLQKLLDWIFCSKNGIRPDAVRMIDRNAASICRQILCFAAPAHGSQCGSFQIQFGTTYQDHALFTFKFEHGKLILDQHSRPDYVQFAGNTKKLNQVFSDDHMANSDELAIPFDVLRKECLRAYIEHTPDPARLNFEGMHINDADLAGLDTSLAAAGKLAAEAEYSRVAFLQYVQAGRNEGARNIDISKFDLTKIGDLTDVNLEGVNLIDIIQTRPDLHGKLRTARLDTATQEFFDIATTHPARPAEPRPFILHSILDDYESQSVASKTLASPDQFLSLAETLDDLHRKDQFLGNIDLDHLRLCQGQAIHVNRQNRNNVADRSVTTGNKLGQPQALAPSAAKIQDQLKFFNTIIDAWAATRNEERHDAVDAFLSSLSCAPKLKNELTLFLLDSERIRQPLAQRLSDYLKPDHVAEPKNVAANVGYQRRSPARPEITHIPTAGSDFVISTSTSKDEEQSAHAGTRGSTVSGPLGGEKINQRGPDLSRFDLSDMDLSDWGVQGVTLSGNFGRATLNALDGARIVNADLTLIRTPYTWNVHEPHEMPTVSFVNTTLDNVKLRNGPIVYDFTGARLTNMNLKGLQSGTGWRGARLSHVNLSGSSLINADLTDSTWENVDVSHAWLRGAVFINTNLKNVNFHQAASLFGMEIDDTSLNSLDWQTRDYLLYLIATWVVNKK